MVRHIGFAALVLVASSVATFADTVFTFSDNSVTNNITATATSLGTSIVTGSGSGTGISINFSGGANNLPTTQAFLTFNLKSTAEALPIPFFGGYQTFAGSFKVTSNADGTGND